MQRLIPLKVPWQISPSTPFLRLFASESPSDYPTQVVFAANFGLRSGKTERQEPGFPDASQSANPHQLVTRKKEDSQGYGLVRIKFQKGAWIRMSPASSDREVLNPLEFDTQLIPYANPVSDIAVWLRDFQSLWLKTGFCPDPCAYTVESSKWIASLGLKGFEHFVIQGHDAYAEVLARSWEWDEVQALPGEW